MSKSKEIKVAPVRPLEEVQEELEAVFEARERSFHAAMHYWEQRATAALDDPDSEDPMPFPQSIDTVIDTAAIIEKYFVYGRKLSG